MCHASRMADKHPAPEWADERYVTRTRGLTHTPLYNLRKAGSIRSVAVRAPGAKYGKRLYHIPSIDAFLARCEAEEGKEASR
jgi:hypothetical protein